MNRPFPAYPGDEPYIFVCYAHADADRVYPELLWLHERGVNVWYDEGIAPGLEWSDELGRRIDRAQQVLFFVSPAAVASAHCRNEIQFAVSHGKTVLSLHLEPTQLPYGLELSLSARQALFRDQLAEADYREKLLQAVREPAQADSASGGEGREAPRARSIPSWAVGLLIVLMAAVGTVAWLLFGRSEEVMALEVSPLVSHVDDARAEDLAIGVHQELVHRLVPIPRLEVTSAPGDAAGPPTGFHLSGTLRDGPDGQLRIGIQLDESGRTIWSKNHDVARADIAEAQTTVAFDTARAMREVVSWFYDWREEDDPQTSLALLRARLAFDATPASVEQTLSYFDQALRRDPDNVFALTGKASAYLTSANWFLMDMREAIEEVEPLIDRALAIDADLGPALAQRAMIRLYNGNYAAAGRAIERAKQHAVAAYPVHVSDLLAVTCGRFDEALALIDRALEIDPTNPMLKVQKGQYLWLARRFGEALAVLDDVLAESPYQPRVLEFKGYVLESLGRFEEAYAIGQWREFATEAYARYGPEGLGHVLVEQAAATEKGLTPFPPQMAWRLYVWGYARLGEPAEAVGKMREGWALGDRFEFFYNRTYAWPGFDAFRASSQFQALMRETIGNPDMCPGYRS